MKITETFSIDKQTFMRIIKCLPYGEKMSLRQLAIRLQNTDTPCNEKTIRNWLNKGKIPISLLFNIANCLGWDYHHIYAVVCGCDFIHNHDQADWIIHLAIKYLD